MKINNIYYSSYFERAFLKLPKEVQRKAIQREKIFRKDCFDPSLRTHKLKGELSKYWSFSINYSYRVLFELHDNDSCVFLDIGTHSIYY